MVHSYPSALAHHLGKYHSERGYHARRASSLTQQLQQIRDIRRDAPGLISPTMMDEGRMGTMII